MHPDRTTRKLTYQWVDSSPIGNVSGAHDLNNGVCTIHSAASTASIEPNIATLSVSIQFAATNNAPWYLWEVVQNSSGTYSSGGSAGPYNYWGTWVTAP